MPNPPAAGPVKKDVSVAAGTLARFFAETRQLPLLYDTRTGFAEREILVPADEGGLDAAQIERLLQSSGFPLEPSVLEDGRPVLYWTSPQSSSPAPVDATTVGRAVEIYTPGDPSGTQFLGKRVDVLEGDVEAEEFLRFLSEFTGLPVYSTEDPGTLQRLRIEILSTLNRVDDAMVRRLLESNGIRVIEGAPRGHPKGFVVTLEARD
jgi:hypothetical protein